MDFTDLLTAAYSQLKHLRQRAYGQKWLIHVVVQGGKIPFWLSKESALEASQSRDLFTPSSRNLPLSDSSQGKQIDMSRAAYLLC